MNLAKMKSSAAKAAVLLKGLANQHRLLVLCHLAEGEKSVGELEVLLDMRQAHLSQHLARLRRDALVETRRDSRTIYYRFSSTEATQLVQLLYDLYCSEDSGKRSRSTVPQRSVGRKHAVAARLRSKTKRR